jgi:cell division transport system permease protein
VKKELVVKVFFCTPITCGRDATPQEINAVASRLEANPKVKSVKFVSKAEALEIMRKRSPALTQNLASNPLPPSEEVVPKKGEYVDAIAASLKPPPPGVEKVDYGRKTAHRILRVARVIDVIFAIAVVILLVASTLLIGNTIRLSIFARRREIEVMKLVGASNWFVRGPFMLEGVLCGFAGAFVAVVLLLLGKELALPAILGHIDESSDAKALGFLWNALILLGFGLVLGAAGSGVTIRRFLRV